MRWCMCGVVRLWLGWSCEGEWVACVGGWVLMGAREGWVCVCERERVGGVCVSVLMGLCAYGWVGVVSGLRAWVGAGGCEIGLGVCVVRERVGGVCVGVCVGLCAYGWVGVVRVSGFRAWVGTGGCESGLGVCVREIVVYVWGCAPIVGLDCEWVACVGVFWWVRDRVVCVCV